MSAKQIGFVKISASLPHMIIEVKLTISQMDAIAHTEASLFVLANLLKSIIYSVLYIPSGASRARPFSMSPR